MTVDWIRAGLKHTGKTRSGLAKALGRSPSAVTDLLNGHRRLRADEIAIVSEYLGIDPPRRWAAAAAVRPRRRWSAMSAPAPSPISTPTARARSTRSTRRSTPSPSTVAVQIRGHSLGALFDNWLVFYDDVRDPPDESLVGRMCVCGLTRRPGADQGAEAKPAHRPVEPALQHRAADLRRRPRLGGAGARNAAEVRENAIGRPPSRRARRAALRARKATTPARVDDQTGGQRKTPP